MDTANHGTGKAADKDKDGIKQPDSEYDIAAVLTTSGVEMLTELAQQGINEATRVMKEKVGEDNPALAGLQLYDTFFTLARAEVSEFGFRLSRKVCPSSNTLGSSTANRRS